MPLEARETTVMIVDDVPENLTLLGRILQKENYRTEVYTNGVDALTAAKLQTPDIILLDISMPQMDGYEVCRLLKADPQLKAIPVIFISALTQPREKIKAFEVGGQDYVTKPFEVHEVKERVRTHLELAWTRRELAETLDQTLTGSFKLIMEFLGMVNPDVFSRGIRLKQNMSALVEHLRLSPKRWFELAATLSHLGLAMTPTELLIKHSVRRELEPDEQEQINQSIQLAASMLTSIPRLEPVSAMIQNHQLTLAGLGDQSFEKADIEQQGGLLLNLLIQFDQLTVGGASIEEAVAILDSEGAFPEHILWGLREVCKETGSLETRRYDIDELVSEMMLREDVYNTDGRLLLRSGIKLSDTIIESLKFQRKKLASDRILVKAAPLLQESEV